MPPPLALVPFLGRGIVRGSLLGSGAYDGLSVLSWCMGRLPHGSDWLAFGAIGMAAGWTIARFAGAHVDNGLLAFAGTMLMVWATRETERKRSAERKDRRHDDREKKRSRQRADSDE